jgi:hypothetical protein
MKIQCITEIRVDGMTFHPGEVVEIKDNVAQDLLHRRRVKVYKAAAEDKKPLSIPSVPGKRCVAICGTGRTRAIAPWDDDGWEIWSCSHRFDKYPRTDRHIEIHHPDAVRCNKDYFLWLTSNQSRVLLAEPMEELPGAQLFPWWRLPVVNIKGSRLSLQFYSCSIAWMIALAVQEGADIIGLWGIDMSKDVLSGREYEFELPSVMFHIGYAVGKGVEVFNPAYSKIFQHLNKPDVTGDQKPNTLYYLGMAAGQGIDIQIPQDCELFRLKRVYWLYDPREEKRCK